jgi:uncharacterized protein YvpB
VRSRARLSVAALALAFVAALTAIAASRASEGSVPAGQQGPAEPRPRTPLTLQAGPVSTRVDPETRQTIAGRPELAARWLSRHRAFRGAAVVGRVEWSASAAENLASAAADDVDALTLSPRVVQISIQLPVRRQAFRNNCETAALSIALRGRVDQVRLQDELELSQPLDPIAGTAGVVWGDPDEGFVGRVEGGGFGVFEGPLARLGRRYDHGTRPLAARSFEAILDQVRAGRPVILWAALGPSTPRTWTTPAGRLVRADLSEHTIVLAGVSPAGVVVHDPWTGERRIDPAAALRDRWIRLGRRAVVTSPSTGRLVRG